jgi:uncharacterized membrane protein SirB2
MKWVVFFSFPFWLPFSKQQSWLGFKLLLAYILTTLATCGQKKMSFTEFQLF